MQRGADSFLVRGIQASLAFDFYRQLAGTDHVRLQLICRAPPARESGKSLLNSSIPQPRLQDTPARYRRGERITTAEEVRSDATGLIRPS